ncbi:MAG: TetR/AcrR family transcriptional regulator [Acidimicrobiales bacterium]|nr:TetR/AcrR family transcriptional regulator [Acidimicrobiales bacterium]
MSSSSSDLPARDADLTTLARIRNAALEGFAARGVSATSIRDVAAAAGVSPGLVQHHFGTKDNLRVAVNRYVVEVAVATFANLVSEDSQEAWTSMGDLTTGWVKENRVALRYLARELSEGDPDATSILESLLAIAQQKWLEPLSAAGALRPEVDRDWAAIHVFVFNLACVLFEPALNQHLSDDFFATEQLQRWNVATTDLYRQALTKPSVTSRKKGRRPPSPGP